MRAMLALAAGVTLGLATVAVSAPEDSTKTDSTEAVEKEMSQPGVRLKIKHAGVFVDDQAKAEKFYTEILGFEKKEDIPLGEFRWLTVTSPGEPDGVELLLEPNANEAARTYQRAIYEQGIPAIMFMVDDVKATTELLKSKGVKFTKEPTDVGTTIIAIFDDTCGNLVQIAQ